MRVLDAGCGAGRNLVYFLRSGYEVFGVDESAPQIDQVRQLAAALAPHLPAENFRVEPVERMSWAALRDPPAIPIHRDSGWVNPLHAKAQRRKGPQRRKAEGNLVNRQS